MMNLLDPFRIWAHTLLRLFTAFVFWEHGLQKLLGLLGRNPVSFPSQLWFAGFIEFVFPPFIFFGLFTRPVAFLLSGEMAVAYFLGHASGGFWPLVNGGDRAVLYCFIYLFLATAGPGRLALDNVLFRKRGRADS